MRENMQRPEAETDGVIEGRNAVTEALRSGTAIDKIYLAKGETDRTLSRIAAEARKAGAVVVETDREALIHWFHPDQPPEAVFPLAEGQAPKPLYAYWNLHGLCKQDL